MQNITDILSLIAFGLYVIALLMRIISMARKKEGTSPAYHFTLITGILCHFAALSVRTWYVGHAPMANLYETLFFFSFCITVATFIYNFRFRVDGIEVITLPAALGLFFFAILANHDFSPLFLALQTIWFEIHVIASFVAYAFFTIAFASAFFFLMYKKMGKPIAEGRSYEAVMNSANLWGFSLFSMAMFSGALWAYLAWGKYWLWEPKTVWSFILWFYFAGIIHGRYLKKWRGKVVAIMTIFGFVLMLFTYLGVSLLMKSSHNL